MTVLLVRHAVAKARHAWDDDDQLRPLNGRGRAQAELLVDALAHYVIDEIRSSPSVRCVDTVGPLAEARGLRVSVDKAVAEGSTKAAIKLVERMLTDGVNAALCSHGDVIPTVLDALGVDWDRCAKGSTWVLDPGSKPVYLPPAG